MFRAIMIPLDGSAFSEQPLPLARHLAQRAKARLHLVHVITPLVIGDPMMHYTTLQIERPEEAQAYLQDAVRRLCEVAEAPVTSVLEGPIPDALRGYVETAEIDLIVMATHGRGPLARALTGSVADELVHTLRTPMLLARIAEEEVGPRPDYDRRFARVLLALDGTPKSEGVIGPAAALAQLYGAEITLLHVAAPETAPTVSLDALAQRLRRLGLAAEPLVVHHDDPAEAILAQARKIGADLIAMETHGRTGLARLFLGSVSDRVAREADCPVLIHHAKTEDAAAPEVDAQELVTVFQTSDAVLARIVAADLQSAGVACTVSGENQGGFAGVGVMEIDVSVRAIDADRARKIIESAPK